MFYEEDIFNFIKFLVTVSASFALSDNLTVEVVNVDNLNLTNDTNADDVSEDVVKDNSRKISENSSSPLYEEYKNGFTGFVSKLSDAVYYNYLGRWNIPNLADNIYLAPESRSRAVNQSDNFNQFDIIVFEHNNNSYFIYTNQDFVDLDNSKAIPVYINDGSIFVGYPKDAAGVDFAGYAIKNIGYKTTYVGDEGKAYNISTDNDTSLFDDQSPVFNQNDTGNVAQNSTKLSKHNPVLETGGPVVALLVCLLVSIVGFRRKD